MNFHLREDSEYANFDSVKNIDDIDAENFSLQRPMNPEPEIFLNVMPPSLLELETGLEAVFEIYSNQGIRDKVHKTFEGMNADRCYFNIGKFTKFLCDFDCKLSKRKITQVYNSVLAKYKKQAVNNPQYEEIGLDMNFDMFRVALK